MLLAFAMHAKSDYAAEFAPKVGGQDDDSSKTHAKGKSLEILAAWSMGAATGVSGVTETQEDDYLATMTEAYGALLSQIAAKRELTAVCVCVCVC